MKTTVQIARLAHEINREYCDSLGDSSQPHWDEAPEWQQNSALSGVEFHLTELRAGREPKPEASHENWLKQKREEGWAYGPEKDPTLKQHPCFMPYDGLPADQRIKDYLFAAVVKAHFETGEIQ